MKPYTVEQINDYTWQISERYHMPAAIPMHLIVGSERAALIDTGNGVADLAAQVREITDKPVTVYNTHCHLDHVGANSLFDDVRMHPLEIPNAANEAPKKQRAEFVEIKCMFMPDLKEMIDAAHNTMVEYDPTRPVKPVEEFEEIDLGGVKLMPILCPGHTPGSLVYVDFAGKNAFCGDAINVRSSIGMRPGLTVRDYQHNVERLLELTPGVEHFYVGHRIYYLTRQDVEDIVECAKEIADGCPGEPYPMIFSPYTKPMYATIHWKNGKRIVFNDKFRE